jgi:hypothetical protein
VASHDGVDQLHHAQSRHFLEDLSLQHVPDLEQRLPGIVRRFLRNEVPV